MVDPAKAAGAAAWRAGAARIDQAGPAVFMVMKGTVAPCVFRGARLKTCGLFQIGAGFQGPVSESRKNALWKPSIRPPPDIVEH